jgi:hypothetical protein
VENNFKQVIANAIKDQVQAVVLETVKEVLKDLFATPTSTAPVKCEKTSKSETPKKVAKNPSPKGDSKKAPAKKKHREYHTQRIATDDFRKAFAHKLMILNHISLKYYEQVRVTKYADDAKKATQQLKTLKMKAEKYGVVPPSQQDVIDIFNKNGWELTQVK